MVNVALQIDQRGLLLKHAVAVAFGHGVHNVVHICVALANVHIVAYAYNVRHEGYHVGGFAHGFAVGNLALPFVQILHLKAQQVARGREGEAGAGRIIPEKAYAKAAVEYLGGYIVLPQVP